MKRFLRMLFLAFAGGLVMLLFLCVLSAKINPSHFSPLAFLGYVFPLVAFLNLIFSPFLFKHSKFWFIISGLVIFLSIPQLTKIIAFPKFKKSDVGKELSVMTYNVRNFDLYNWRHNEISRAEILETIAKENVDLICFQEFYDQKQGKFQNVHALEKMGYKHHIFIQELMLNENNLWGISIFSKYPIVNHGEFLKQKFPTGYGKYPSRGIYADLLIAEDTIRLVNVHLQSIYLQDDDLKTISEAKEKQEVSIDKGKTVLKKINRAFRRRGVQVREVKDFLDDEQPYPIIFCGDFNDTPYSFAYQQIARNFKDAFIAGGVGLGATYNREIPGLRIDFILLDENFKVHKTKVLKNEKSDHFPIVTRISLP